MSARDQHSTGSVSRTADQPSCPACGGRMWDNRTRKRNPKAPDFKCRAPECTGRIWPGQISVARGTERHSDSRNETNRPGPLADAVRSVVETVTAQTHRARARAELRACYLDATEFVLAEVRPKYEAAGVPCGDSTVAAITATLFIATCNRGAVGHDADDQTTTTGGAA